MQYQTYCKPTLSGALNSVGLAKTFHRATGQYLYYFDEQGQEQQVLDLLGGYGALFLGHNHPAMVETLVGKIKENVAFHNQFSLRQGSAELAEFLNPILQDQTGWNETFLCAFASTGAESVEVALKHAEVMRGRKLDQLEKEVHLALEALNATENAQWQIDDSLLAQFPQLGLEPSQRVEFISQLAQQKLNQAPVFIALKHAFHGKLNASIQLTYGDIYRKPFRRLGLNSLFVEPSELTKDKLAELAQQHQAQFIMPKVRNGKVKLELVEFPWVGAIMVEPVQGEGGVYALTEQDANALHLARDVLACPIIADEVQSGCGRCGSFLAGSQINLKPDYVVLSKGLGGGVAKIGLVAIRESAYAHGFDLVQSSTFGEDDWSAAVAMEFIKQLSANQWALVKQAKEIGERLKQALQALQHSYPDVIADIRGKGLLQGIVLKAQDQALSVLLRSTAYQDALGYLITGHLLCQHGIRVAPPASSGNVVRIEPSVLLTDADIQALVNALEQVCLALRYQDTGFMLNYLLAKPAKMANTPTDFRPWYQSLGMVSVEGEADNKVAFVNHLIASEWIKEVDPSLDILSDEQANELLNRLSFDRRVAPFPPVRIRSKQGNTTDFTLYPVNATSQQISEMLANNDLEVMRNAIDDRLAAARADGCTVAGLGMFTSIVTNNGKSCQTAGIKLTTGNALTVAMAAQAIAESVEQRQQPINKAAVIGAAGNIGSVYCTLIAEYCADILLVGSGRSGSEQRLKKTAAQIYLTALNDIKAGQLQGLAGALLPFAEQNHWLSDEFLSQKQAGALVYQWFAEHQPQSQMVKIGSLEQMNSSDLVICAANASEAFIASEHLKHGALICDIAVPHNISEQLLHQRQDLACLRGGIVATPNGESLDPRARAYLKAGQVYACMAETIVLGLEHYQDHFSYGNIDKHQVKAIAAMAAQHGLTLAETKNTESM